MFEQNVTLENGHVTRVVSDSKENLAAAVKAVKATKIAPAFDINVPVRKGHDLLNVGEDATVELSDGTGAHNSPRDAVRDDGSVEGNADVPVVTGESVDKEVTTLDDAKSE